MIKFYSPVKRIAQVFSLIMLFCAALISNTKAQTTINTPVPTAIVYYSDTEPGVIVFGVRNNNSTPIVVTNLASYVETGGDGTYTLWYKSTGVTGAPNQVTTANGWQQASPSATITVTANGVMPILSGLNVTIPANTTYRFALQAPIKGPFYGQATSTPDIVSLGGVDIFLQNNTNSPCYAGAFNATPGNTPRSFYGSLTFVPANSCTGTPTPGNALVVNNTNNIVCGNSTFTLDLSGNTTGTGQTYQWQSGTSSSGPWTNIGTETPSSVFSTTQTATSYYRCIVKCGSNDAASVPVQVISQVPLPGNTYTIDKVLAPSSTNFTSFATANAAMYCGIGGPVVFNVTAGQTFTEPPLLINASGNGLNTITFKRNGTGANPVLTPSVAGTIVSSTTVGADGDGIITINGGDYITFDGIDLNSNSFAAGADMYEYGYYFKKAASNNASKNVTIKNSSITLNKNAIFSFGIYVSNFYNTVVANVVSNGGRTENIKLDSNTISNCYGGIQLRGVNDADFYDQNIEVGVQYGNNISGFGGAGSIAYGIYAIYQNNLKIVKNSVVSALGNTTTVYGIYTTTGTNSNVDIYNNDVTVHGGGTTTTIYGIYNGMGATGTNNQINIYNNKVSGCTYTTATSGGMQAIAQAATAFKVHIYNNDVTQNTHSPTTSGAFYGIYQTGAVVNESKIYNNRVTDNARTTGTTGAFYCIENSPATTANSEIYGNTVSGNGIAAGTTSVMYGISHSSGAVTNIYKNQVFKLVNNSTGGGIYGLSVTAGTTNNVHNNFISNLEASQASLVDAIRGINVNYTTANTNINVQHNTVYLNATSSGTNFSADGIYHTTSTTATSASLKLRNNIFVNLSTANGTGVNAALRRSSGAANMLNNFSLESNSNLYYVGTPNTKQAIFYDGTNTDQTLVAYKTRVGPNRDSLAFSENPPFVNVATAPYDLHIQTTVPTQIESNGRPTDVVDDIDGNTRSTSTPDVGADEFTGIGADLTGPVINYTALPVKSICIENKVLTAVIDDPSTVNTTAGTKPRLWFKKSTNANVLPASNTAATDGWKWVEASNAASPFSFTMDLALLNSAVVAGDSISYFIVSQDMATTPNVSGMDVTFNAVPATVALSTAAFPATGAIKGFIIIAQPSPITVKVNRADLCVSGSVTLDVATGVDLTGGNFQWQRSHHNSNSWSDIAGGTVIPFTTPVFSDSSDFRLVVKCGGTAIASSPSNVVTVNANNPQIISTNGASRCGTGTVSLTATAPSGIDIKWFSSTTSQVALGTGSLFVTPSIANTTTFYAAASTGGGFSYTGMSASPITSSTSGSGTTNFGLVFDALSAFTLNSVVVYPISSAANTAGTITIDVIDGSSNVLHTATVNVVGNPAASAVAQRVALNFNILPGTNLKLRASARSSSISGLLFEPAASAPGGNYGYPYVIPGVLSINSGTLTAAPTNTARLDLYYYFYNWEVATGCIGSRVPVVATVSTPPALTLASTNNYKAICNDAVDSLSVTSTASNFNSYVWSPVTNLYTDLACTIPYTGTSALKVYVKGSTVSKTNYKCTATNTTTSCSNEVTDTLVIMPAPNAAITVATPTFCLTGSTTLSLNPSTGYGTGSLQWQSSPNGSSYVDIAGANNGTYTTPSLTSSTYYQVLVKNSAGQTCGTPPTGVVNITSPQVTSTAPATRCGAGTVNLSATPTSGHTINWYADPTGGTALYNGNTFTTPTISSTTTYYAAASAGGSTFNGGKLAPETSATATVLSTYGHIITITSPIVLNSVQVFSTTGTAITISLYNAGGTTQLMTTGSNAVTAGTSPIISLGWSIQPGTYRLSANAMTGNFLRDGVTTPSVVYPIALGTVGQIDGYHTSQTGALTTGFAYYFMYNLSISTGCESARTPVVATVDCSVPISLLNFKGEKQGAINKLEWTTSTELNNAGFELQRSTDGINFSKLAFVASKATNGNSSLPITYGFNDEKPLLGNGYYRLKQMDKDGTSNYSKVVLIKAARAISILITSIYPNPVQDKLGLTVQSPANEQVTVVVTDISGRILLRKPTTVQVGENNLQLNVANLAAGSYFVKLLCNNGCETPVQKFVK